jgi:branched-chain amino acid transport system ATP-binding protein
MLELIQIDRFFGHFQALKQINLTVEEGEFRGLIGPNGSGKTTIFNMISGYYRPTSGAVVFKGQPIQQLPTHRICHLGIGRTFQVVKPLGRMSVLDNVIAAAFSRCNSIAEARAHALSTIEFCGMTSVKDQLAKSLPIAGRKRLEIARAMATRPELLLLDETAAGLNPSELLEAIELIQKIRANGTTIVIIEHIMHVIMTISDRIHAINFGQTIAEGTPKEVAADQAVIEAYLGTDYA